MKWRRPSNATIGALVIFLVSFGIWLTQPTPDEPGRTVLIPGVDFEFLTTTTTTTTTPPPVDTTPATQPPPSAPPPAQPTVETTVAPVEPETTTTVSG
ncbi:MAG: hypothetical protein WC864_02500 [Ilumatobacteraceae bacterium]